MNIKTIQPRWYHGFANDPGIDVLVDKITPWDDFEYINTTGNESNTMLISTNCEPWVRFVYISNPRGNPTFHGALGGNYKLTVGGYFKTGTGWSSRAGVINRDYSQYLKEEIVEVFVKPDNDHSMFFAGFAIYVSALRNNPAWPNGLHLVRQTKFSTEPVWTISTDPYKVVKPPKEG